MDLVDDGDVATITGNNVSPPCLPTLGRGIPHRLLYRRVYIYILLQVELTGFVGSKKPFGEGVSWVDYTPGFVTLLGDRLPYSFGFGFRQGVGNAYARLSSLQAVTISSVKIAGLLACFACLV